MPKPPAIDLGNVSIPARDVRTRRTALSDFTTKELKDELLDRDVTDFSRLQPFIRNALLIVMFAAVCVGYWGMKCHDGIWSGGVCNLINL